MTARLINLKEEKENYPWLKNRGYLHITPQLDINSNRKKIISLIKNPNFISKYAFFPLIHSVIQERRYKRLSPLSNRRGHVYTNENGEIEKTLKSRPLHYATHLDAAIFGYYADILYKKYEEQIKQNPGLSECIIAYRKLPIENSDKNKGTVHFAHETFEEIKKRALVLECEVLKFDIKSFFSRIDHSLLKKNWSSILGLDCLPNDHYNVFKAATRFSYILKDDLRINSKKGAKRSGFDEKKLSDIRKSGKISFFNNVQEFRSRIKDGTICIHRSPFRNDNKAPVGIPQGLPISAILANIYLFNFDLKILKFLVQDLGAFYRRYSDDIVIACKPEQADLIEQFIISSIKESLVKMSEDKTERFLFKKDISNGGEKIISIKVLKNNKLYGQPFTYLGFEFYGYKTLVKSSNLSKFYRRMIRAVKTKSHYAHKISLSNPTYPIVFFRNQLVKLYIKYPLSSTGNISKYKRLVKNERGEYMFLVKKGTKGHNGNYLSYMHRASEIMSEDRIKLQIRNHNKIFTQAIKKHFFNQ